MLALRLNVRGDANTYVVVTLVNNWLGEYRQKQYFNEKQLLAVLCTL